MIGFKGSTSIRQTARPGAEPRKDIRNRGVGVADMFEHLAGIHDIEPVIRKWQVNAIKAVKPRVAPLAGIDLRTCVDIDPVIGRIRESAPGSCRRPIRPRIRSPARAARPVARQAQAPRPADRGPRDTRPIRRQGGVEKLVDLSEHACPCHHSPLSAPTGHVRRQSERCCGHAQGAFVQYPLPLCDRAVMMGHMVRALSNRAAALLLLRRL